MAIEHLVKGEPDWHIKMNNNMDELKTEAGQATSAAEAASTAAASAATAAASAVTEAQAAASAAAEIGTTKVDIPVDQELEEGYLYQELDGTTSLREGGGPGPGPTPGGQFKYTMIVDNGSNSDPAAITYADDCVTFIPANVDNMGDWGNTALYKEYFKPCVIAPTDAVPKYYLQQNNMTLKEDGTAAVLTGADGDVMIEVKKLYGKITTEGNSVRMSLMNYKEDDQCFCFSDIGGVEKDVMYRGAYEAGVMAGATTIMRSISGVAPLVSQTRAVMRGYAKNRGAAYHQNNVFMLFLWQWMYLLLYRHRNSQTRLGQGRTLATNTSAVNTGTLNTRPFCWGDQGGVNGVKFLGVEHFYGNVWEFIDGVTLNTKVYKVTRYPARYDDVGANHEISIASGLTAATHNGKYLTQLQMTKDLCFLPKNSGGSDSTYWCDIMYTADAVQIVLFGGGWNTAAAAGAFCWSLHLVASYANADIGSRLCRE